MLSRPVAGALVALALVLAPGGEGALAQPPPAPSSAPATPPAAHQPQTQSKGAIVVAVSEGAGPAARALAFEVYRDPDLRPSVDDATARVLAGEAPPAGAPPRLKELAELRASIAQAMAPPASPPAPPASPPAPPASPPAPPASPPAPPASPSAPPAAPPAPTDLVARRLLSSLGTELGATLVITVGMDGSRPIARALRASTAAFERIELGPTVDIGGDGARSYRWPGAVATLRGLLPGAAPAPAPLAPKAEQAPAAPAPGSTPFYKSPWFWGSVGGAVAVGLSVFLISRATSSTTDVHLMGKVGP